MPSVPPDSLTPPRRRRPGFSLVLSLVVMSVVLLTVITVASFVTIESRLSAQHQNFQRAKLNAAVSLRLALAHLQQEAGPDRRMTARADILANTTQPGWTWNTIRNPLWTDGRRQPPRRSD
jgi:Tfp pilus assembly protein PilX